MDDMVEFLKGKNIVLYGYGISNKSIEEVLIKNKIEYLIYIDGQDFPINKINKRTLVIKSNGIPPTTLFLEFLEKNRIQVINDLELYSIFYHYGNIIGITGSNGKTTTGNLINKILDDSKFIGNNGVSLISQIDNYTKNTVIECSSFMLNNIKSFHPHIFVLLNIEYHHIDYHKSFSNYLDSKLNPLRNMNKSDLVVFNYDDKILRRCMGNYDLNIKSFSLEPNSLFTNCYLMDEAIYYEGKEFIKLSMLNNKSKHNIQNIMAAIITCKNLKINDDDIKYHICNLENLPHRIEKFHKYQNVTFFNDSKATNPYATLKAIEYLSELKEDEKLIWIGGGKSIKDDYSVLESVINLIDEVYLYGENRYVLNEILISNGFKKIFIFEKLEELIIHLRNRISNYAYILFSPASTSFDMFKNFEERGNYFKNLILKYY